MRYVLSVVLCVGLAASLVGTAWSQPNVGDTNVSLSAAFNSLDVEGADSDSFSISADYGRFVSESLEVGAGLEFQDVSGDVGDATSWLLLGKAKHHFLPPAGRTTVPYVGLQLGFASVDSGGVDDTSFAWGAMAGLKSYDKPNRFWLVELSFLRYEIEDADVDELMLRLGQGFVF